MKDLAITKDDGSLERTQRDMDEYARKLQVEIFDHKNMNDAQVDINTWLKENPDFFVKKILQSSAPYDQMRDIYVTTSIWYLPNKLG